ncbi:MAG TPA: SCO family protein [Aliiroseovarius sp.]|nr:SCO family protein [Aliiroseovarius sp.]
MGRIWAIAAVIVLAALGGIVWYLNRSDCDVTLDKNASMNIGGPLSLVDETGRAVTDADMFKKPTLLYFGYTFCPDVCPLDNARNAEVLNILQARGYDLQAALITIDPERDTPEALAEFTDFLHPDMTGYTGTPEQIKAASLAYKTYYARVPGDDDEFYLMDHTTFTYLILPGIGFVEFFRRDESAENMAERVACYLDAAQ